MMQRAFYVEEQNEFLKIHHLMVFELVTVLKADGAFSKFKRNMKTNIIFGRLHLLKCLCGTLINTYQTGNFTLFIPFS